MLVPVPAGTIDIEEMMCVLERRHAQFALGGKPQQPGDQVRLAGIPATHDAADFHAAPPLSGSRMVRIRALDRRTQAKPLEIFSRLPLVSVA
jgi:hypothetical protein